MLTQAKYNFGGYLNYLNHSRKWIKAHCATLLIDLTLGDISKSYYYKDHN